MVGACSPPRPPPPPSPLPLQISKSSDRPDTPNAHAQPHNTQRAHLSAASLDGALPRAKNLIVGKPRTSKRSPSDRCSSALTLATTTRALSCRRCCCRCCVCRVAAVDFCGVFVVWIERPVFCVAVGPARQHNNWTSQFTTLFNNNNTLQHTLSTHTHTHQHTRSTELRPHLGVGLDELAERLVLGRHALAVAAPGGVELHERVLAAVDQLVEVLGRWSFSDGFWGEKMHGERQTCGVFSVNLLIGCASRVRMVLS